VSSQLHAQADLPSGERTPVTYCIVGWVYPRAGKVELCLTKHYAMKDGVEWMYRPAFSRPRHWMEVSGQLHSLATLPPGKEPPVVIV
jgi:hypothetical protein